MTGKKVESFRKDTDFPPPNLPSSTIPEKRKQFPIFLDWEVSNSNIH